LSHILCPKVWACIGYNWVQGLLAPTQCGLVKLLLGRTKKLDIFVKGSSKWPTAMKYWTFEMDSPTIKDCKSVHKHEGYVKCTQTHLKTFAQGSVSVNEK
jgi:hypothetical protein